MVVAPDMKRPAELALRRAGYSNGAVGSATTIERRDQVEQAAEQRRLETFHIEIA
jgi:hypothetical protein